MNGVLLIPCVGPMQSWGTRSRFQERDTEREPSKSGIIGMLCAALGRDRSEPVDDMAALKMAVRVDREGKLGKDFQTAEDVAIASGRGTENLLSNRYYLADAAFLIGLEGSFELLETLYTALARPVWSVFLGRKSYVPTKPLFIDNGLHKDFALSEVLNRFPLLLESEEITRRLDAVARGRTDKIRFVIETDSVTHEVRQDQPRCYAIGRREFGPRYVTTSYLDFAELALIKEGTPCT